MFANRTIDKSLRTSYRIKLFLNTFFVTFLNYLNGIDFDKSLHWKHVTESRKMTRRMVTQNDNICFIVTYRTYAASRGTITWAKSTNFRKFKHGWNVWSNRRYEIWYRRAHFYVHKMLVLIGLLHILFLCFHRCWGWTTKLRVILLICRWSVKTQWSRAWLP